MPKISVLMPVYNTERYLDECISSIVNQTFSDFELIIINDGSTDNSPQICDNWTKKDNRIKVIHKQNSGYGASLNIGLENATSDYIAIVESDDFAKHEMLEELYKIITENDCDFVKSDFYLFWTNNNKTVKYDVLKGHKTNIITNLDKDITMLSIVPSIWSALYKKTFLDTNNIRFLETPGASYQDTSFYQKTVLTAKKLVLTDKPYIYYRQDNENSSVKNKKKIYCIVDEYKEIYNYINNNPYLKKYEGYIKVAQFNTYYWNFRRLASEYQKEFFDYYHSEFKKYYDQKLLNKEFYKYIDKDEFKMFINMPEIYFQKFLDNNLTKRKVTFAENLFSVKNIYLKNKKIKEIRILGLKIYLGE